MHILYRVCLLPLIQLAVLVTYTLLQASLIPRLPPSFSVAGEEPGREAATVIEEPCLSLARLSDKVSFACS